MFLRFSTKAAASPICATFHRLSQDVWETLEDAASYKLSYGEESLTEMLLLELKRAHPREVVITPSNRRQESRNGADWAWWFQGRQWLGMRVQAKKLYPSKRYEALADRVGKSKKLQIDLLLAQAKKDSLFPMFCFYNYWNVQTLPLASLMFNCYSFLPSTARFGCTLACAWDVKQHAVRLGKDDLTTISRVAFPWICLTCCPPGSTAGDDLSARVFAALQLHLSREPPPPVGSLRRRRRPIAPQMVDRPPAYVMQALDGHVVDTLPAGIAGVAIFSNPSRE